MDLLYLLKTLKAGLPLICLFVVVVIAIYDYLQEVSNYGKYGTNTIAINQFDPISCVNFNVNNIQR